MLNVFFYDFLIKGFIFNAVLMKISAYAKYNNYCLISVLGHCYIAYFKCYKHFFRQIVLFIYYAE